MTDSQSLFSDQPSSTPPVIDHVPEPPPPPPARQRRGGTPLLLTLVLFAGLAGGLYYVWSHPQPGEPQAAQAADASPAIEAAKAELAAKIQALSDRVDKLEKQPAPEAPPPAPADAGAPNPDLAAKLDDLTKQIAALSARQDQQGQALQKASEIAAQKPADLLAAPAPEHQAADPGVAQAQQQLADLGGKLDQALAQQKTALDALDQRLGKLEQAPPPPPAAPAVSPDKDAIDTLNTRVEKLEQTEGQITGATRDAALAVKLEAAQAALQSGQPLGALPGAPPALARFATTSPPTEAELRAEFPKIAAAARAASRPEDAQTSFFGRALARVEQSVTVRRGDEVIVGDPAAGVLARAQDDVNEGDLKGAIAALSALKGAAASAVQGWVEEATALLEARAALAALAAHG